MSTPTIRPYTPADAAALAALSDPPRTPAQVRRALADLLDGGGRAWVIAGNEPLGYATLAPAPGLPGVGDLDGRIALPYRRQGLGGRLLAHVLAALPALGYRQATHAVADLAEPAARLLLRHGFHVAHVEQTLRLENLGRLPPLPAQPSLAVRTLPRATAVALFRRLYDRSFGPWPWYQPYTPGEIAATLARARDLLFLHLEEEPIGFAWLQQEGEVGVIEPFGVAPGRQGRGYGRYLLIAALHTLAARSITAVQIGAWETNHAALGLYRRLGFRPYAVRLYLARNVNAA